MYTKLKHNLLTITEVGMLLYWCFATLVLLDILTVDPALMYSDYKNPTIVAWNWSFFPLDILFSILGLLGRFTSLPQRKKELLTTTSLSLMFCAGLMAISFWAIRGNYDPIWWSINLWLMGLSTAALVTSFLKKDELS